MLVIEGVSRRFGSKAAVADVSFQIERGSFVGVIGRSVDAWCAVEDCLVFRCTGRGLRLVQRIRNERRHHACSTGTSAGGETSWVA